MLSILAEDLHTFIARVNFTVTSYLAVSAIAPSIAGDAADTFGRRPVYLVTLLSCLSTTLIGIYHLNELEAGLIYLPYVARCLISTLVSGKLIDRDYWMVARKYGLPIDKVGGDDMSRSSIEEARLRSIFAPTFLAIVSMIGYGWAFTIFGGSAFILAFLYFFQMKYGVRWRVNKRAGDFGHVQSKIWRCGQQQL
ncbi:hypothetical protein HYALB_00011391 [Hymenoscyphus albidus]|uniref:Uncharacterized protein n=1 Tax=Hymenoscyphus albidus TaxID=595503 RepID=A0A9N9LHF9_9HELO|nr:hypothetical protein HYALB_00011391 [Hymenoscyphus albidus]